LDQLVVKINIYLAYMANPTTVGRTCGNWQTAMISLNAIDSGRKVKRRNVAMMPYAMM
jgi:hypothetical protein